MKDEIKAEKILKKILKKMCSVIKVDYGKIDFDEDLWFLGNAWDKKQEDVFRKWFVKYLLENKEAREFILARPTKTIGTLKKVVDEFIFNYWWKSKE